MNLFGQIDMLLNLITALVFVIMVAVLGNSIYRNKYGSKKKISKEELDYSGFDRKDTLDYLRFDDIDEDMIITDNGKRFIGILKCDGYDFYSAHPSEQVSTAQNFMGFINTITSPVSYRQHCKAIDLEDTMLMYREAYEKLCAEIRSVEQALRETQEGYKKLKGRLTVEEEETYFLSMDEQERSLKALNFRRFHMEDQMYNYIAGMSRNTNNPKIEECWVFDWVFDSFQFSVELTDEEIKQKAVNELMAKGNAMRHALSACKVKSRRLNTWEMIDVCRRHSSPLSAERYKLKDVVNSSFFEDIQTSASLEEMESYAREVKRKEVMEQVVNQASLNEEAIEKLARIMRESDEAAAQADRQEPGKKPVQQKKEPVRNEKKQKENNGKSEEIEFSFDV